jgi:hypothetical protein
MRCRLSFVALAVAVLVVANSAFASTITGNLYDGKPTVVYEVDTGVWTVSPEGTPVGLFDILSDVPIFNATPANLPSGALFTTNTTTEKAWASLGGSSAFTTDFNLGSISAQFLPQAFLNQHLTITYSGGFGTPNVNGDLFDTAGSPEPTTLTMLGLAIVGGLGLFRRRC